MTSRTHSTRRRATGSSGRALDREAWLAAGLDAIAEEGFGAARILSLAKRLGVTRGSFYWHFRNHDAFVRALLEQWRDGELRALASWHYSTGNAEADLRRAVHRLVTGMARDGKGLRIELAVQDYARRSAWAAGLAHEINRSRMAQGQALFEALTGESVRARELTLLLYTCITGARLILAASPRNEKMNAIAQRLERVIDEAIVAPNMAGGHGKIARSASG